MSAAAGVGVTQKLRLPEWIFGMPLAEHLASITDARAAARTAMAGGLMSRLHEHDLRLTPADRLEQLETCGDAPDAKPKELEYAALLAPIRTARALVMRACTTPGSWEVLVHLADLRDNKAETPLEDLAFLLKLNTAVVSRSLSSCNDALAAADGPHRDLIRAFDELDYTPSRVGTILRTLQMSDVGAGTVTEARGREYAALFAPVRGFRRTVADTLATLPVVVAGRAYDGGVPTRISATEFAIRVAAARVSTMADIPVAVESACQLLGTIMSDTGNFAAIDAAAAMTAVSAVLGTRGHDTSAVQRALKALCAVAERPGSRGTIVSAGGVTQVVAALEAHPDSEPITAAGCGTLGLLSAASRSCNAVVAGGGLPALVAALAKHAASVNVVQSACTAVARISIGIDHRPAVVAAGALPPVLRALTDHAGDAAAVVAALSVVENLASGIDDYRTTDAANAGAAAVATAGGIPALVSTVAANVHNPGVAAAACMALGAVATTYPQRWSMNAAYSDVITAGVAPVLAVLKTHAANPPVLRAALEAFAHVVFGEASAAAALSAGAVGTIIGVLTSETSTKPALVAACRALDAVAGGGDDARTAIAAAGGIQALITPLVRYSDDEHIAYRATQAFYTLMRTPAVLKKIASSGASTAIQCAMYECPESDELRDTGREVVYFLEEGDLL